MIRRFECLHKLCQKDDALRTAESMIQLELPITRDNAYFLLQCCMQKKNLKFVRQVQLLIVQSDLDSIAVLGDHLIRLFSFHGSLFEANEAFNKISIPTTHTMAALFLANAKLGGGQVALELYHRMQLSVVKIDKYVFAAVVKACTEAKVLSHGRIVHDQIIKCTIQLDEVVWNSLIHMYVTCQSLHDAFGIFDALPGRNVVSWNAIIAGYAQTGDGHLALEYFEKMQQEGIEPDEVTFIALLKACINVGSLERGRIIHHEVLKRELQSDTVLGSTLVHMYVTCASLRDACNVFDKLPTPNVVSWNAIITGFAQHGAGTLAFQYFDQMQKEGIKPTDVTFFGILKACVSIGAIERCRCFHEHIIEVALPSDMPMLNTLIDVYTKCGSLDEACKVFVKLPYRDLVSWNAMISAYAQYGEGILALECFAMMEQESMQPDELTFLNLLKACLNIRAIVQGRFLHTQIIQRGFMSDVAIGSALVHMYATGGALDDASQVFDKLLNRNEVSWNAVISGCAHFGEGVLALQYFEKMQEEGFQPTEVTIAIILKACASIVAIEQGRVLHEQIIENGQQQDPIIGNTLIDMYFKCGNPEDACNMFCRLATRDLVSWNAMIGGYAQHGDCIFTSLYFDKMQQDSLKPDDVSFTSILVGCSRAGLVDEGLWYFKCMRESHGISPTISHCNSMVDLLCRAGFLVEAEELLQTAGQSDLVAWKSLLSSCRLHGDIHMASQCFVQIISLDSSCAAGYELMSHIYADTHMHEKDSTYETLVKL